MTNQALESLTYRDETFSLFGSPLYPFLEKNKQINFELFTTAHWRGYQGSWLLKDDSLYITNLESSNYTYEDIFNSNEPVLADWYSGILKYGFGEYQYDDWSGYYDNYVWLKFENGKVVDKKITMLFSNANEISFGKYKGKKLEDILYGKIKRNTYTTIKKLFECILSYLSQEDYSFKVQCGKFEVNPEDIDLANKTREYGVEYFLTQNYIATSTKVFWENSSDDNIAEKLSELLERIFKSDFTIPFTLRKQTFSQETEIAENCLLINPDVKYLNWALKNIEFFTINPLFLNETYNLKRLKSFNTNRLNKTIFEYEPIIENIEYKFPDQTQRTNQQKFEKKNQVLVDYENKLLVPDLTTEEMMLKYGYYLDETYEPPISNDNDYEDDNYEQDYDNYYERKSYGQYAGSYAQDIEGLSDEFINDVLDGDPDAYWNID
jgi:hypothetical protein